MDDKSCGHFMYTQDSRITFLQAPHMKWWKRALGENEEKSQQVEQKASCLLLVFYDCPPLIWSMRLRMSPCYVSNLLFFYSWETVFFI